MSQRTTPDSRITPTIPTSHDEADRAADPASGRVGFDSRGNAVWEYRTKDQNFARDASTTHVRKLQTPSLSLEKTGVIRPVKQNPTSSSSAPSPVPSGPVEGGSPYDRNGRIAMQTTGSAQSQRGTSRIVVTSRKVPSLLDRLKEWMGFA